jgi:hypothetical protein
MDAANAGFRCRSALSAAAVSSARDISSPFADAACAAARQGAKAAAHAISARTLAPRVARAIALKEWLKE